MNPAAAYAMIAPSGPAVANISPELMNKPAPIVPEIAIP